MPKKPHGWVVKSLAVGLSPVLFGIGACTNNQPEAEPPTQTEDTAPFPTIASQERPKINDRILRKFDVPTDLCFERGKELKNIDLATSIKRVKKIDFLENDLDRLHRTLSRIQGSTTLSEAYTIATEYLKARGLNVHFYGPDQFGFSDSGGSYVGDDQSTVWNVSDVEKIQAVARLVNSFTALPKKFYTSIGYTDFYIPESIYDNGKERSLGGYAGTPYSGITDRFFVALALSDYREADQTTLIHELLGHTFEAHVCGVGVPGLTIAQDGILSDATNNEKMEYPSEYSKEDHLEYFAEIAAYFFSNSLTSRDKEDGVVRESMEMYVHWLAKYMDMPVKDILALANVYSAYGSDRHPLAKISSDVVAADILGRVPNAPTDPDHPVFFIDTPDGKLPLECDLAASRYFIDCHASIRIVSSERNNPEWAKKYKDAVDSFDLPIGGEVSLFETSFGETSTAEPPSIQYRAVYKR